MIFQELFQQTEKYEKSLSIKSYFPDKAKVMFRKHIFFRIFQQKIKKI